jgi:hypothetical protein
MNLAVIITDRPLPSFLCFAERDNLLFHSSLKLAAINISSLNEVPNADAQVVQVPHLLTLAYRSCSWEAMGPQ